jgi:hypothetical protein
MIQESTTGWDFRSMPIESSPAEKLYILFLLVVFIVALVELIGTWRTAPSEVSLPAESAKQVKRLRTATARLKQWIYFTFLVCGFLSSYQCYRTTTAILAERNPGTLMTLVMLRRPFLDFELTFLIVIFVFLVRWHIVRRIAKLND